jgi:hypothetical protein
VLTIEARAAGRRRPLLPNWELPPPPELAGGGAPLTLAELIARVVRSEVAAFEKRKRDGRFMRLLSEDQIAAEAMRGRVDPAGRAPVGRVDEEASVGTALESFEDGRYLVLIDGRQYERLDEQVLLGTESTVTFLRLVPLAGG